MLTQDKYFTMRVNPVDRAIFAELARRLGHTQSESLRLVAREVVTALRNEENQKQAAPRSAEGMTA